MFFFSLVILLGACKTYNYSSSNKNSSIKYIGIQFTDSNNVSIPFVETWLLNPDTFGHSVSDFDGFSSFYLDTNVFLLNESYISIRFEGKQLNKKINYLDLSLLSNLKLGDNLNIKKISENLLTKKDVEMKSKVAQMPKRQN